ncbi:MAG: hypothetical protein WAW06_02730 [bacterium]
MKVFICGIIQGSISEFAVHEQSYRTRLRSAIEAHLPGAVVYCPVSLHPESLVYDDRKAFAVLEESAEAARKSDLLVAYLPEASMGSAVEMWEARRAGVKIVAITPMEHNWVVRYAADLVVRTIEEFELLLADGSVARLVAGRVGGPPAG